MAKPRNAIPESGSHVANPGGNSRRLAVLTGRAVVLTVRVEVAELPLLKVSGVVENAQVAPAGKPEQLRDTCPL